MAEASGKKLLLLLLLLVATLRAVVHCVGGDLGSVGCQTAMA